MQFLATKTIPISRMAPELSLKFQCSSQECMEPWLGMQFLCAVLDSHKTFALSAAWLVVNKSKGFILKQIFLSRVSVPNHLLAACLMATFPNFQEEIMVLESC